MLVAEFNYGNYPYYNFIDPLLDRFKRRYKYNNLSIVAIEKAHIHILMTILITRDESPIIIAIDLTFNDITLRINDFLNQDTIPECNIKDVAKDATNMIRDILMNKGVIYTIKNYIKNEDEEIKMFCKTYQFDTSTNDKIAKFISTLCKQCPEDKIEIIPEFTSTFEKNTSKENSEESIVVKIDSYMHQIKATVKFSNKIAEFDEPFDYTINVNVEPEGHASALFISLCKLIEKIYSD